MGEGEHKRKPPAPPPAKGKREASEEAKTSVYKPIPLEPESAEAEPPLPPRKRGSTISGIPGRKGDPDSDTEAKGPIPPPAPLLGGAANKTWGLGPKPVALAKTAGPFKVRPPEPPPPPAEAKAPKPVKLEKTAGPWKVPAAPAVVPPPPKGSARESGPSSPTGPPPVPSSPAAETMTPADEGVGAASEEAATAEVGTTTTGLVAALTDEIVAAQEEEEAEAAAAEAAAAEANAAEDSSLSGVQTLVGGARTRQLDAFSVRFLAAGWFVAGAALVALFWALSGGEPEAEPAADVRPSLVAAPMPILVLSQAATPEPAGEDLEPVLGDEAGETGDEEAEGGEEGEEDDGGLEEGAEPAAEPEPVEQPRSARSRSKSRKKKKPAPEPAQAPAPAPKPAATPKPKPPAPKSAAQLLSEARAAYKRGDAAKAHALARASRTKSKTNAATELMVRSSCKRKQASTASRELKLLPLLKRGSVKRECRAMGVKL